MKEIIIEASNILSFNDIEQIINNAQEFTTIKLAGDFYIDPDSEYTVKIGENLCKNILTINNPYITVDGSNAKITVELSELPDSDINLVYLTKRARHTSLQNMHINLVYGCGHSERSIIGINNNAYGVLIKGSTIDFSLGSQINAIGIYSHGGIDTNLETMADNLRITDNIINIRCAASETPLANTLYGIYNDFSNSLAVSGNYIFVQNKGTGAGQKAIGMYNIGRYARINDNNIKANGTHNKGGQLEQAHCYGVINEGMLTLFTSNNCVAEWCGHGIGLVNKGYLAKIEGNKILATHTIWGITVQNCGDCAIISNNIINGTSRNAKLLVNQASNAIISYNLLRVLHELPLCNSGVGMLFDSSANCTVAGNQIIRVKNCGIYLHNSQIDLSGNYIEPVNQAVYIGNDEERNYFVEVSDSSNELLSKLIDERRFFSIYE